MRITPAQAIAIEKDYATQNPSIVDAGLAMDYEKKRIKALDLGARKPETIAYRSGLLFERGSRGQSEINWPKVCADPMTEIPFVDKPRATC